MRLFLVGYIQQTVKIMSSKISTAKFVEKLKCINPNIAIIGEYIKAQEPIRVKCLVCGHEWDPTPNGLLVGKGCPNCASSFGERKVSIVLKSLGVSFIREHTFQDCRSTRVLPFDFYLPDYNACIEFDGIQHFEPVPHFGGDERFAERKRNDEIKTKYCDQKGIRLLRIPYFNICSVERDVTRFIEGTGGDLCE